MNLKIDEIFCFVAVDEKGDEGIPAFMADETMMPMVGGDKERMESMKPIARLIEKKLGKKIRLFHFTNRKEIPWKEEVH